MSPHERESLTAVPPWPVVQLVLDPAGRATVDGRQVDVPDGTEPQASLLAEATRRAADLGRPLRVRATDPVGDWYLVAFPDGEVVELPDDLVVTADGGEPEPHDPDEPEGSWHLLVHPSGVITAMDELPAPTDDDYVPRPAAAPDVRPDPAAGPEPDLEPEPEADAETETAFVPEPEPAPKPAPEPVLEPEPIDPGDVIPVDPALAARAVSPADAWYDMPPPPPLLAPDPSEMVHDLRSTVAASAPPRSRRWIPVAAAGVLGVLAVTAITLAVRDPGSSTTASGPATTSRTAAPPSGSGQSAAASGASTSGVAAAPAPAGAPKLLATPPAVLDIGPPPGFSTKPLWALPVPGSNAAALSADGLLVTRSADRQVALVDPANGTVRWHAQVPDNAAGPYLSRVGGKRVVAVLTPSELRYWSLTDQGVPADGGAPVAVTLPAGSAVTWAGPSPLVTLGDGTAAVVRGSAVQRVSLPTGSRPLAADGTDVLAVSGRNWIRQPAGQAPGTPQQLALPQGATGQTPIRVENVGGSFLGAMWAGPDGPIVAVYDARSGGKLVQATFPKDVDFASAPAIREVGSERTAVGTALFEPAQHNLSILASSFTPVALTPGHVFANDVSGSVADLQIKGKDLTAVKFTGRNPTVPVGIAVAGSRSLALVVVPNGSGWLLAALPPV